MSTLTAYAKDMNRLRDDMDRMREDVKAILLRLPVQGE